MTWADWSMERRCDRRGLGPVAGVDEAGRGCLAGPVVAAAVVLGDRFPADRLRDSKQLSAAEREHWYETIRTHGRAVARTAVEAAEIDRWNILEATRQAMRRAVDRLPVPPGVVLIDAVRLAAAPWLQISITRGDEWSISIAAASIVAKVERDRIMRELDRRYPGYGFRQHKGYATAEHRRALRDRGPSPAHRRSFRPVREASRPVLTAVPVRV